VIPPPNYLDEGVRERFRFFHRGKDHVNVPGLAKVLWKAESPVLAVIEGGALDKNGRLLATLRQHLFDKKLPITSREQILLDIARTLARLQEQRSEVGGSLYHGFLLPRNIMVGLDDHHTINRVVISGAGMAYALGHEKLLQKLTELREGRLPIERHCAQEIVEQLVFLAPEQKKPGATTSPSSDLYAFGALAVCLLSHQRFVSPDRVDWTKIPQRWVPFLQACLQEEPSKRPQDLLELEDWLDDPELALTHAPSDVEPVQGKHSSNVATNENLLTDMLKRVQPVDSNAALDEGLMAIKAGKWQVARKSLAKTISSDPNNALAHANLAIAYFELDDKAKAEAHYEAAKKADPLVAKAFRQHLAFRL
jgi:serine/threonine protein kinase